MQPERIERAFGLLLALTLGLIVLGALVRANQAGLACPDWPLCFGEFVPKMDLRIGFEWTHRLVAGSISLLFVLFGVWAWRAPATPQSTRRLLVVAGLLLGVQVLLGALTVWKLLAAWTVTSHLLIGNAFAVSLLWITLSLHDARAPTSHVPASADVRHTAVVWLGASTLGFVTSAIPLQLENEWITIGWSLLAVAVLFLWQRREHAGLKYSALLVFGLLLDRLGILLTSAKAPALACDRGRACDHLRRAARDGLSPR